MSNQPWVYIVLLGIVIILYARLRMKRSDPRPSATPTMREMEETLEHFAADLEQENEQLLDAVARMKTELTNRGDSLAGRVDELEKRCYEMSKEMNRLALLTVKLEAVLTTASRESNGIAGEPLAAMPEPPASPMQMKLRYPDVFELHEQGKSVELIARKLGKNKGEINLILQLARQEEQSGV